ncbi:MAG: recombinase family protein [Clostridia bacterium]|nr:recombinase family protein [Clostridia bacterium]
MMIRPEERAEEVAVFVDNGFSGGNTDRDGFQKMMRQIGQGSIRKIIVYRLDRISRSLSDFVSILDILKSHGVQFVSSQESFDTSTPYGEMIVKILMVFAEFERRSIIERITQAYAHRSELGIYMGGRRPYGFSLICTEIHGIKTKMLDPLDTEIGHIRYIFEMYAREGVTLRRLMDSLIKRGMLPQEGSWSSAKLSAIIQNPIYVMADNSIYEYYTNRSCRIVSDISAFDGIHGVQLYGKTKHKTEDMSDMKIVVMPHAGIIPAALWLACQKKIVKNKQIGNAVSNTTSWLGGRIRCKKCGRVMRVAKGSMHTDGSYTRYLGCTGKSHNRICDGVKVPVYAESLENMVYGLIAQKLTTLKDVRRNIPNTGNALNQVKNRISEIRAAKEKLVDFMLQDSVEPDMLQLLNGRAEKLSAEQQALYEKMEELENHETELMRVTGLYGKWKNASYEEKKAVAALLIDRIYIQEDGTTEVVWNI